MQLERKNAVQNVKLDSFVQTITEQATAASSSFDHHSKRTLWALR